MKIQRIILVVMTFGSLMSTVFADTNMNTTMYLSLVTDGLGFYKVRNLDMPPRHFTYDNRVLNINQGDTMIWENDADISTFTIVSDQNLWNSKVGQIKVGNKINYKFDNPGTYTFYIKEASSKRQTIIVFPIGDSHIGVTAPIPTPSPTIMVTPIISPTINDTIYDINISTHSQTIISAPNSTPVDIPIKITPTTIASMIVAMISIYATFRNGKRRYYNKKTKQ